MLLVAISLSVTGEILLKQGMNRIGDFSLDPDMLVSSLFRAFTNPFVLGGFVFIFSGSIFWLAVLSRLQLSYAYPMLSLSYVIVVFASWIFLGEDLSLTRLAGVLIIVSGVFVVFKS